VKIDGDNLNSVRCETNGTVANKKGISDDKINQPETNITW
jgi:hypothetical protein